ncbi:hypothetical protein QJS66_13345 [Kocuria rhizophila]|nr:hypothetical protein QJS66_13345 [Kocuria rhizophila]
MDEQTLRFKLDQACAGCTRTSQTCVPHWSERAVTAIDHRHDGATVTLGREEFSCDSVIVAGSGGSAASIDFTPALPAGMRQRGRPEVELHRVQGLDDEVKGHHSVIGYAHPTRWPCSQRVLHMTATHHDLRGFGSTTTQWTSPILATAAIVDQWRRRLEVVELHRARLGGGRVERPGGVGHVALRAVHQRVAPLPHHQLPPALARARTGRAGGAAWWWTGRSDRVSPLPGGASRTSAPDHRRPPRDDDAARRLPRRAAW